jgi:hypothetical protein
MLNTGAIVMPEGGPQSGAIGEVKPNTGFEDVLEMDQVVIDFPQHPSPSTSKWWRVRKKYLIPLSDPDIDLSVETPEFKPETADV